MMDTFTLSQSYLNVQEYLSRWGWSPGGENGESGLSANHTMSADPTSERTRLVKSKAVSRDSTRSQSFGPDF